MKKFYLLPVLLILFGCSGMSHYSVLEQGESGEAATGLADWTSGSQFTHTQANILKNAIDANAADIATKQDAMTAGVDYQVPLTAGTDYQEPLTAGVDYEAVDAAIMRTDAVSEIAGLAEETSPDSTDLFVIELGTGGTKAKLTFDDLATAINPGAGYRIVLDNTQVTITDDGVADGQVDIIVDGTTVLTATADGITMGPMAATANLTANNTFSSNALLTGLNAGATISQWQTVYFDGTAGEWLLADANLAGAWPATGIAVAASTDGNALDVMTSGWVRYDTWNWTPGQQLCLSETAGGIIACSDASLCSADGDCYQVIGWAATADIAYFDFTQGWAECNGN